MNVSEPALGGVRVANEVIASIAGMAACEIEGVVAMDETNARTISDRLKRTAAHRGVRVVIDGGRALHLDLYLTIASRAAVPPLAEAVQANVTEAVERMLGLEVAEVNVVVSSVAF